MKRTPLSKSVRFKIFNRDLFTCQYCGRKPPAVVLEVDHIVAVSKGGPDSEHNLLTACFDCNRGKRDKTLGASPVDLGERAALIKERAAQVKAYERVLQKERQRSEVDIERVVAVFSDSHDGWDISDTGRNSVRHFLTKLPPSSVVDAMEMACARVTREHVFRYFCGICWKWVKEGRGA